MGLERFTLSSERAADGQCVLALRPAVVGRSGDMELSSLIAEAERDELCAAYREKRAVARPVGDAERFRALWSDWEFEAICRFTLLPDSDAFRLVTKGKQVPPATYRDRSGASLFSAVQQFRHAGATVNFARLELCSNHVLALNRSLERALGCPSRVHFFSTPPHAQGLGVHADHGDVLVLQVQGRKSWDIYHGSNRWPAEAAPARLKSEAPETITLAEGGWLFLPQGVYHEVRNTSDGPSTHFTIGFQPLTWGTAIESALQLARPAVPELRANMTPLDGGPDEAEVELRLRALRPFVARAVEAERYGQAVPSEDLPERELLDGVDAGTRCIWQGDAVAWHSRRERTELSLSYRNAPVRLRAEFAEVIKTMSTLGDFAPAELGRDAAESVLLCKFLANVGVLRLLPRRA